MELKVNPEHVNTHENAIEVLIKIAAQRLDRDQISEMQAGGSEITKHLPIDIKVTQHAILVATDYLNAVGYFKDPDKGLHVKE